MKRSFYRLTGRFAHQDVVLQEFLNCSDAQEATRWAHAYISIEANVRDHTRLHGVMVDAILTHHIEEETEVKRFTQ